MAECLSKVHEALALIPSAAYDEQGGAPCNPSRQCSGDRDRWTEFTLDIEQARLHPWIHETLSQKGRKPQSGKKGACLHGEFPLRVTESREQQQPGGVGQVLTDTGCILDW